MEKAILLKATCGERIDILFEKMVKQSQETNSDVFGLFNGKLFVAFQGIETADEIQEY